jgi:UDP-N-acetylmuramoyl-L-alanyl-D-glutamate--2,6-diaminopimelate ligase
LRLIDLIGDDGVRVGAGDIEQEIAGLTADSRRVSPGFLFAALSGSKADGAAFIADALAKGASAILASPGVSLPEGAKAILIQDENPRRRLALLAARFHGRQPENIVAVTGTNGKTSTVSFVRHIWSKLGRQAASMGTLGVVAPNYVDPESLTTPDPVTLHETLARLSDQGVSHLAMEASSHGLDQCRLDGVRISAAAFTNLTRDHLDYHGGMEAYFQAKARLFTEVLTTGGTAVLNADSPEFERLAALARAKGHHIIDFGRNASALTLGEVRLIEHGQIVDVAILGLRRTVKLPLAGDFQVMNALAALGLAIASGEHPEKAMEALETLEGVPGRLQLAATLASGASVYVDYAHTPDALENVLSALRPHTAKRLIVVFGCGGDRDAGKRPQMGALAARLADHVIVTDDNPRSEEPALIRSQILAACPGAIEIGDRKAAIRKAVGELEAGDVLVLAGKGHERGQIVKGVVHPFDDAEQARLAVKEREA